MRRHLHAATAQGNLEVLVIYYWARLLARSNVAALAAHEGRDSPAALDDTVSTLEASFTRKAQSELLGQYALVLSIVYFLSLALFAAIAWQLTSLGLDLIWPAQDPLAF